MKLIDLYEFPIIDFINKKASTTWIGTIFLILLSGFAEAFGISVLVPVVTSLIGESLNSDTLGFPFDLLPKVLKFFGLPINFGSILNFSIFFMILSFLAVSFRKELWPYLDTSY